VRLFALILAAAMAAAPTAGPVQPVTQNVPGELIVKCAPDSDAGRLVERLLREDPNALQALDATLASLADRVGLPLTLERLTSGAELLLRLDAEELLRRLEGSVAVRPEVQAVKLIAGDPQASPLQPGAHLFVEFAEASRTAATLAQSPGEEVMRELITSMTGDSDIPVVGTRVSDRALALYPNYAALLALFKRRLEALPEVDYVQVNIVMGFGR
jgi:hypothetical protein